MLTDTALHQFKSISRDKKPTKRDADEAIRRFNEKRKNKDGFVPVKLSQINNQ